MTTPAHTDDEYEQTIQLIEECLKEGFAPPDVRGGKKAIKEASIRAVERGVAKSYQGFQTRYYKARNFYRQPDWALYRPPQYQRQRATRTNKPEHVHITPEAAKPDGKPMKVLAIGDCHDDPRIADKQRFTHLGRMAAALNPDAVVQIGDWATFDSVSRHEDRSTLSGRALPSFEDDLASLRMSLMAFSEGLGDYPGKRYVTLGNHEDRVRQYENQNAVMEGSMWRRVLEAFEQYGWHTRPFGEYLFLGGVGFTHVPLTIMGRPYGGKTLNSMCNDAVFSLVFGHSHKGGMARASKIGPNRRITIYNLGCSLPEGHIEDYCRMSTTGWEYGAHLLDIQGEDIQSGKHYTMAEIEREWGHVAVED